MSPTITAALEAAATNWHHAQRDYERAARLYSDARIQLDQAERDLHELARAIEVAAGSSAGELASNQAAPLGSVTMPIAPISPVMNPAPDGGEDAGEIVLQMMRSQAQQYGGGMP
jgi:hypothetical protein